MLKSTQDANRASPVGEVRAALQALFDQEESNLLRYVYALTGRRAVAEEIVQEVFLQLVKHWGSVQSPKAWLFRSAKKRAFHYYRKQRRELAQSESALLSADVGDEASPDELLVHMEACAAIRQVMADLNDVDRTLVELKYFEGLKYREISEQTGMSIGNVGYHLHRILKELAMKLQPLGIDGQP